MSIRRHQRVKWSKKALYLAASLLAVTAVVTTAVRGIAQEAPKVSAFQTECAAKAEAADKANAMAVEGKDGWFFLARELRHLSVGKFWGEDAAKVSRADKPEWADSLPVILNFKEQLDKAGIRLLFVPVPPKAIVYPDMLGAAAATAAAVLRLDPHHQEFYRLLREKGVAVLDLTDDLIQARANETAETRGYCRTDTHWSPGACELAARRIRETAGDALGAPPADNPFHAETRTLNVVGDLERSLRSDEAKGEPLRARVVSSAGEVAAGATEDKGSPVLLMGDSHCLVFHVGGDMLATGAGLADQLAYELRRPVDLLGVRGSGATPARINLMRRAAADTNYLAGKKLVVWCFSAREFTESSGWRQVPIVK